MASNTASKRISGQESDPPNGVSAAEDRKPKSTNPTPDRTLSGDAATERNTITGDTVALPPADNPVAALRAFIEKKFRPGEDDESPCEPEMQQREVPAPEKGKASWTGKVVKSLIGLALVIAVGWLPALRYFQVSSVEAVVNARLITLRAPIEGVVEATTETMRVGARAGEGDGLFRIVNPRADRSRLDDLKRELARQQDEQEPLLNQLAELEALRGDLENQVAQFRQGRIRRLQALFSAQTSELSAASAQRDEAAADLRRLAALQAKGAASQSDRDEAAKDAHVASETAKAITARRDALSVELDALRGGTFIGDSYNDQPRSLQRLDELDERIIAVKAELGRLDQRQIRLGNALREEETRYAALSSVNIGAPVDGRVWEILTSPGEQVTRGQDLLRLLDCSDLVVTAAVSESVYNQLSLGTTAEFRFREGGPPWTGEVVQLTGVASAPANLAILPSALIKASYRVMVSVSDMASAGRCPVGRTGRVIFTAPDGAG